jgi:hypothetical protein
MGVMQEDQCLADLGIDEADAAGEPGLGIGDAAAGAAGGEFAIGELEKGKEGIEREAGDLEGDGHAPRIQPGRAGRHRRMDIEFR